MASGRIHRVFDADALHRARKAARYGLHKLAVELSRNGDSITAEALRQYEHGIREPRVNLFYELARVLRVKPETLTRTRRGGDES